MFHAKKQSVYKFHGAGKREEGRGKMTACYSWLAVVGYYGHN